MASKSNPEKPTRADLKAARAKYDKLPKNVSEKRLDAVSAEVDAIVQKLPWWKHY
ncbi:hypothetical protein Lfu02_31440 [Longispora fulva]|uniref:Uncharacterized protein n=1 Tax=Longispora fulva TaxID=619741 RepID=A0A8J7GER3_9ACTN|nr:hypothetical protein [Longispora fulva]MBG6139278.1 hypothetical protein [Longispora fulva]GIG58772.1 hypothetical protein Lfu02_31440 [Longispora fulva]